MTIHHSLKYGTFSGAGITSERHEVVAQARDRMEQAAEIWTLCLAYAGTEYAGGADAALRYYAGTTLANEDAYERAKSIPPHTRWALLQELRALGRPQTAQDEGWAALEASGAEMLRRAGL